MKKIKEWIKDQLKYRSCTIVLVGSNTANRKWINYEIKELWKSGMGVVGIYIHGLKNQDGYISIRGKNPFDYFTHNATGKKLSEIVKCFNPQGANSKEKYAWIFKYISAIVEDAIKIRQEN